MTIEAVNARHRRIRYSMRRCVRLEGMDSAPIQRQDSTTEQLTDLWMIAAKLGMYGAADWLWEERRPREARYDPRQGPCGLRLTARPSPPR